ncbi:fimbrial biogenesis chaperone [Escherichia coli]|uniref:fimbrial biogenesis chaperone n=1 Tax=Escherichia coli TaxID=562 RepID=UPI00050B1B07|nr:molecular chaperone [Escherichia coli]EGE2291769.1 molecular chaperone [Escherichia coli]EKI4284127.1 molecular chaperone [Escherichia coli]HDR9919935.1 molecular chaperone [Escherichia coli RDEC-1 (10f)]
MKKLLIALLYLCLLPDTLAGIRLNKTRVIMNEDESSGSITFVNTGEDNYLVQAYILDTEKNVTSDDFLVVPPVFRSDGGRNNVLKILKRKEPVVKDRESVYKLVFNAIPGTTRTSEKDRAKVSFSLGFVIKMFYRPDALKSAPDEAYGKLSFLNRDNGIVQIYNDSEYNLSFSELKFDNKSIDINKQPSMIRPFDSVFIKVDRVPSKVLWKFINDYGGETPEYLYTFKR